MVIVDTNILVYLLIEGDRTREAQALYARDPDWHSDAFILIEFSNVLATYCRAALLNTKQAEALLIEAEGRLSGLTRLLPVDALRIATRYAVSAYDARFIGAASAVRSRLVTEDPKLRAAAPTLTRSLDEALADG